MFNLGNLSGIQDKIANSAWRPEQKLNCNKCKTDKSLSKEDFAKYLKSGWPKCCGQTMSLI